MSDLLYASSHYAIKLIEFFLSSNLNITGQENIPKGPTLFVANHFTRSETFFLPYAIYQHTGKKVRALADDSVFVSHFGTYLQKLGALSIDAPNRNNIILGGLISGHKDWLIFPEGKMVKNKRIVKEERYKIHAEKYASNVHTGAAMLALKAEDLKRKYAILLECGSKQNIQEFEKKYFLEHEAKLSTEDTLLCPVSITYIKIRPGANKIKAVALNLIEKLSPRLEEEIELEGNLLIDSEIHIHFSKPINVKEYLERSKKFLNYSHLGVKTRESLRINYLKESLTTEMMQTVYNAMCIHFEHLFAVLLHFFPEQRIEELHFKCLLVYLAKRLQELPCYNFHANIKQSFTGFLSDEALEVYEEAKAFAIKQGILVHDTGERYIINRHKYFQVHHFHTIRQKNTFKVLLNEVLLYKDITKLSKEVANLYFSEVKTKLFNLYSKEDIFIFEQEYATYKDEPELKKRAFASPFYLESSNYDTAVVLSHGFSSTPQEVKKLALFLAKHSIACYGVRLKGHGCVPKALASTSWQEWYEAYNRGATIMSLRYKQVFLFGFSTGGVLSLLAASKKRQRFSGVITVNAALKLQDIRIKYLLPTLSLWNDLMSVVHNDATLEYVDNKPEHENLNYNRIYLSAIEQLKMLIEVCHANLEHNTLPTLVIQAKHDPVVNPESAEHILKKSKAHFKEVLMLEYKNHGILNNPDAESFFQKILEFIELVKEQQNSNTKNFLQAD